MKPCYGKCDRCVWKYNNGCSEWNGYGKGDQHEIETCPKCGGELKHLSLTTYPPIPKKVCTACGWSWTGEPEKIEYVPVDKGRQSE